MTPDLEALARAHFGARCGNCGSDRRCRARYIIPPESGGHPVVTNLVYHCRACEMAASSAHGPRSQQLVNVWVSTELLGWIRSVSPNGSQLARSLVALYLDSPPERFEDLSLYQDPEMDSRLFVYLNSDTYPLFKRRVSEQNLTVTGAISGLFKLYQVEGYPLNLPEPP